MYIYIRMYKCMWITSNINVIDNEQYIRWTIWNLLRDIERVTRWSRPLRNRGFGVSRMQISSPRKTREKQFPGNFKDICAFFFFDADHLTSKLYCDSFNDFLIACNISASPNRAVVSLQFTATKFIF